MAIHEQLLDDLAIRDFIIHGIAATAFAPNLEFRKRGLQKAHRRIDVANDHVGVFHAYRHCLALHSGSQDAPGKPVKQQDCQYTGRLLLCWHG